MAKENNSTMGQFLRELGQTGIYKRSQGRIARQVTFAALELGWALGMWRLSVLLSQWNTGGGPAYQYGLKYGLCTVLLLVGTWVCYRAVNLPSFADFLIAVEAEMNKVSWPSRSELVRSSMVVLITIFAMAAVLFAYDTIWRVIFTALGVTK
ncbi:MAG: preprotein translocase subunit SecE [Pirellulales bacterium]